MKKYQKQNGMTVDAEYGEEKEIPSLRHCRRFLEKKK